MYVLVDLKSVAVNCEPHNAKYSPLMLEAMFMPFRDVIISDGLVMPYNILVGGGMKRMVKDVYMEAKKNGRIHRTL